MATVRQLVTDLQAGGLTLDQVIGELRGGTWPRPPAPARTDLHAYLGAEDVPGDNDVYWIDEAFSSHIIDEDTYVALRNAIRASWPSADRPSGD